MNKAVEKREGRVRRHKRVRKQVHGTPAKPRLAVFRSNVEIYAQIVDDTSGKTLVSASSIDKEGRKRTSSGSNSEGAREIGKLVAERAKAAGIEKVVFDRGGNLYHGRVKALAEGAREAGLQF
ncbi:MAG: 50S ribosomal protein L18 [Actinobacteria bacterium]|nr:MAG: 50S ribosomal protein L18 [Actinomycetota bacterium]